MSKSTYKFLVRTLVFFSLVGPMSACVEPDGGELVGPALTDDFPAGFMWGTATAGVQVDAGCPSYDCTDRYSDWYQWSADPDLQTEEVGEKDGETKYVVNGDRLEDGPGHWELYETDFNLAKNELHNTGFRMSLEWSRLFTQSTEGVEGHAALLAVADATAVAHYHAVFAAMKARGITPVVTLNHYSFPLWIHNGVACHKDPLGCTERGWLDADRLLPELAKFSGFVAQEYGGEVDWWATINEPFAVIVPGYLMLTPDRTNPPGISMTTNSDWDVSFITTVILNMIVGHARMYDAVHTHDTVDADGDGAAAQVGLVPNLVTVFPLDPANENDVEGAANADYLYNKMFLDALTIGNWDPNFDGVIDEVRSDLKGRMDYVAINYYTKLQVRGLGGPLVDAVPKFTFVPDTTLLFDFYPRGLYEAVMRIERDYDLPVIISENGTADGFEYTGGEFLIPHLAWLRQALIDGADVRGYFFWSLVDNYEWNHGYDLKFGMYSYDPTTKQRKSKPIAAIYGEIGANNALRPEMLEQYGGGHLPTDDPEFKSK